MSAALRATGLAVPGRLAPLDLELPPRSVTAVIGPNGSGKTSLLRALAGINRPLGSVWIGRERLDRLAPARRSALLSFLPAAREVAWPIPVRDLIGLGLGTTDQARVEELLDALGLAALAERPADRLSTGERARVLLARALASRPAVLLLDEPLSNLDPFWVLNTMDILRDAAAQGAALLVSLHDLSLLRAFDRVLLMGGGSLQAEGKPAEILGSQRFGDVFGVEMTPEGWRRRELSWPADRQSSP